MSCFLSPSSDAHVLALLSLKNTLSGSDMRSIRQSVAENRIQSDSANQSPTFFSMVKVKWINNKINQIGLKKGMVLVGQWVWESVSQWVAVLVIVFHTCKLFLFLVPPHHMTFLFLRQKHFGIYFHWLNVNNKNNNSIKLNIFFVWAFSIWITFCLPHLSRLPLVLQPPLQLALFFIFVIR